MPKRSGADLTPIEMAVAKPKAHLRSASARNFKDLNHAFGDNRRLFTPAEFWNFFKAAGNASATKREAPGEELQLNQR